MAGNRSLGDDAFLLLRTLDVLDVGLAFLDRTGAPVHRNQTLTDLLDMEPPESRLKDELHRFTRSLVELAGDGSGTVERVERLLKGEMEANGNRYLLRGSYVGFDLWGEGGMLLITLERLPDVFPTEEAIRQRFALSRREARIAKLLAEGRLNVEIAGELGISPHTARNHTQAVLRKLGLRTRAQVGVKLLQGVKND